MDDEEIEVQVSSGGYGVVSPWGCVGPGDMALSGPTPAASGLQKGEAKMYSSYQVMYTVGYSLSLGALLLALLILLGLRYMAVAPDTRCVGGGHRDRAGVVLIRHHTGSCTAPATTSTGTCSRPLCSRLAPCWSLIGCSRHATARRLEMTLV